LPLLGGSELERGDEEGVGLADRLEVAVELDRSGAVSIAERPAVRFSAELGHFGSLGVSG
jgi:hypothetical protein